VIQSLFLRAHKSVNQTCHNDQIHPFVFVDQSRFAGLPSGAPSSIPWSRPLPLPTTTQPRSCPVGWYDGDEEPGLATGETKAPSRWQDDNDASTHGLRFDTTRNYGTNFDAGRVGSHPRRIIADVGTQAHHDTIRSLQQGHMEALEGDGVSRNVAIGHSTRCLGGSCVLPFCAVPSDQVDLCGVQYNLGTNLGCYDIYSDLFRQSELFDLVPYLGNMQGPARWIERLFDGSGRPGATQRRRSTQIDRSADADTHDDGLAIHRVEHQVAARSGPIRETVQHSPVRFSDQVPPSPLDAPGSATYGFSWVDDGRRTRHHHPSRRSGQYASQRCADVVVPYAFARVQGGGHRGRTRIGSPTHPTGSRNSGTCQWDGERVEGAHAIRVCAHRASGT